MAGNRESTGPDPALSSDSMRRVTQYQTAGVNARLRLFALLEAQGEVVELGGMAPAPRGVLFADGWDEGVMAVSEAPEVSRAGDGHGAAAGGVGRLSWPYVSRTRGSVNGRAW